MLRNVTRLRALVACGCLVLAGPSYASELVISDVSGNIAQVDTTNGHVTDFAATPLNLNPAAPGCMTGCLTDVALSSGILYGTTYTTLYSFTLGSGALTPIGSYTGETNMNGLTGGPTGLVGGSNANTNIYSIDPTTAALSTIAHSPSGYVSGGDFEYVGSTLYESAANTGNGFDYLLNISTGTVVGQFQLGGTPLSGVFGLAYDGSTSTMYAVDGNNIYTVNLATASLSFDSTYAGNSPGLGDATGAALSPLNSVMPSPGPTAGTGLPGLVCLGMMGLLVWRKKRNASTAIAMP